MTTKKATKKFAVYELPEDKLEAVKMVHAAALVYGLNELAKGQETLGAKAYYRMLRDEAERRFIEAGGEKLLQGDPPIMTGTRPAPRRVEISGAPDEGVELELIPSPGGLLPCSHLTRFPARRSTSRFGRWTSS